MEFPEVFIDNKFKYIPGEEEVACADGLAGWACCMAGAEPPKLFGQGMVKISTILGVSSMPEALEKYADNIISKKLEANNTAK